MAGENVVVSTDRNRGVYSKAVARYPGLRISQGYLRSEVTLENGNNTYNFELLKGDNGAGSNSKTENKLSFNDAFVISHYGLFLLADDTAAPGTNILQTYPNEIVFGLAGVNAKHLEAVYNGNLLVNVADRKEIPALNTRRFRSVLGLQQSTATNNSENDYYRGMLEATPNIDLSGSSKIEIQLSLPSFGSQQIQTTATGRIIKVVFEVSGYLVQGGAKYIKNGE